MKILSTLLYRVPEPFDLVLFLVVLILAVVTTPAAVISVVWNFTVPDLFVGLVDKGILPAHLDLLQAFKLEVFLAAMGGIPVLVFLVIAGGISSLLTGDEKKDEKR